MEPILGKELSEEIKEKLQLKHLTVEEIKKHDPKRDLEPDKIFR